MVVIYSGIGKPLAAVRVAQQGGQMGHGDRSGRTPTLPMYMSSPGRIGRHLVWAHANATADSSSVPTRRRARRMWTTRDREGENAALVLAGD